MCTIDQCDFFEMSETSTKHELANEQLAAAQEVLRVSEQRYRAAFETSLDAIAICRMDDGMFVDVNRQFFSILGIAAKNSSDRHRRSPTPGRTQMARTIQESSSTFLENPLTT